MNRTHCFLYPAIGLLLSLAATDETRACTGIRLKASDGVIVCARTMEFGYDLRSQVLVIPRQLALRGTTASGKPGLAWRVKYGAAGMNGDRQPWIVDGLNEKGLAAGIFYFPGYAEYQTVSPGEESQSLAPWELVTWMLSNFATVDEVRAGLLSVKVAGVMAPGGDFIPPLHYIVHDVMGNALVVEYLKGALNLVDNPIGVITNAPEFDWHVKNLSNYVNLSAVNVPPIDLSKLALGPFGQGSGLLGLPGDFTPPSRFVRAAVFSHTALQAENGEKAVEQAFHILDSFDIPRGSVRDASGKQTEYEYTQWTSASDLANRRYYFHTENNRRVRRLDLLRTDLDREQTFTIPLDDEQDIDNVTPIEND